MYFFKVLLFHVEIYEMIIQCLSIFALASTLSDLICLHLRRFSANIFWNIAGNRLRRSPFSVSCKFMRTSLGVTLARIHLKFFKYISLVETSFIGGCVLQSAILQKELLQVRFLTAWKVSKCRVIPATLLKRGSGTGVFLWILWKF